MKEQENFHIESNKGHSYKLGNEELSNLTILKRSGNKLKVQFREQIMEVEIIHSDHAKKVYTLQIDGKVIQYKLETTLDVLVREMGMDKAGTPKVDQIISPMPGLVLDILVNEGDELAEGTPVLILEAMKMENVIKAPSDVHIDKILVKKGDSVEKHAVLLRFK